MVRAGWLALLLLLPGCLSSGSAAIPPGPFAPDQWVPHPCDPDPTPTISKNAPPIWGLRGSSFEVAKRVAHVLNHTLLSTSPLPGHEEPTWETDKGQVEVAWNNDTIMPGARWPTVTVSQAGAVKLPSEYLVAVAQALGADPDSFVEHDGGMTQRWNGQFLGGSMIASSTGEEWDPEEATTYIEVRKLAVLPAPTDGDEQRRIDAAESFLVCLLASEGKEPDTGYVPTRSFSAGYEVVHGSIAEQVAVVFTTPGPRGHCDYWRVALVDAVTNAIHGEDFIGCD